MVRTIMSKRAVLWLLAFTLSINGWSQKKENSRVVVMKLDLNTLEKSRDKTKAKDPAFMPAYEQLMQEADGILKYKPVSVIDKTDLPPSGDKHDYMSIGPYWWPDPSKPGGTPYIRKDGEINPEVKNYPDKENMPKLCSNVYVLSLAYYFSGNEAYAKHASKLIKVWFLDSATAMNPHLNYGQAIKGVTEGRAEGIIEARHFIYLLDAVELLKNSESFKEGKRKKLVSWFKTFLNWLQTSPIGKDEMEAKNNHGVWYDATCLAIAVFVGDKELANKTVQSAANRLETEMDVNGFFPLELARTTSEGYSTFVLEAFTSIAQLSENTNLNFWTYRSGSGRSLEKGYQAMLPYWEGSKSWTYPQIKPFQVSNAYPCLWRAASRYDCNSCREIIRKNDTEYLKMLINLL